MIEDITHMKDITKNDCKDFFDSIDTAQKGASFKARSAELYTHGYRDATKERKQYALRGPMQATIVKFFDGIDEASGQAFRDKQLDELHDFLDSLWHQYDKEEKGFIGIDKVKTLLEDISVGTDPVTVKSAEEFLENIDGDHNGTIEKTELANFIYPGLILSKEEREETLNEIQMYSRTMLDFFAGVEKSKLEFQRLFGSKFH